MDVLQECERARCPRRTPRRNPTPIIEGASPVSIPAAARVIARCQAPALLALLLCLLPACGGEGTPGDSGSGSPAGAAASAEVLVARDRAAALFSEGQYSRARDVLAPLVAAPDAAIEDLINAACIELELMGAGQPRALVERAATSAPDDPRVQWALYRLYRGEGDFETALVHVRRAYELMPDSYATRFALASLLGELDMDDEGVPHLEALVGMGESFGGSWYRAAVYKLFRSRIVNGRMDEANELQSIIDSLEVRDVRSPTASETDRGELGIVSTPVAVPYPSDAPRPLPAGGSLADAALVASGDVHGVAAIDLVLPETREDDRVTGGIAFRVADVPSAALLWGPAGLSVAKPPLGGTTAPAPAPVIVPVLPDQAVHAAVALDADRDGDLDLVAALDAGVVLLVNTRDATGDDAWEPPVTLLETASPASGLSAVDYDHEGDVDLLVVGPSGIGLLRNDGFGSEGGGFTEVAAEAGLPASRAAAWCVVDDFDVDQDVDLLIGGGDGQGAYLASNERGGRFSDASAGLPLPAGGEAPCVRDMDGDGRPDLVSVADGQIALHLSRAGGGWREAPAEPLDTLAGATGVGAGDPFLEGRPRILRGAGANAVGARRASQVLRLGAGGLHVLDGQRPGATSVSILLQGIKDNTRGVGAVIEVRAGAAYQRLFARGEQLLLGLDGGTRADVVRVTWPNGVVQSLVDLEAGQSYVIEQKEGLVGSCPFLYAWNGETYGFITDVLGGTPLGLPMAPGQLVPPDHDEFVLLTAEQLVPRDGVYEVQLTEELREVTYLDHVRLDIVDHPPGTEAYPNERFTFPPFPEERLHVFATPVAPTRAVGDDGRDWTAALHAIDGELATPYRSLGGQFLGLSEPHVLELAFDPDDVPSEGPLRLAMTGWFLWTDASVNVASARQPGVAFEPPVLEVPDGEGGWRATGPPVGFPAGKSKTMVLDLDGLLVRDDPRLRVRTTLCLAWDAIRLAVGDDHESRVVSVAADGAELWRRGFSAATGVPGEPLLETFHWDDLEPVARWNQHPGRYTRYGDVAPLLGEVDDRMVIFGSGDALTVRFPADDLPPLPDGWVRDHLLYLDGWAKDRDPNTERALHVEPLPFHGMSGYPYGADEAFPDDAEHREWRRVWNTRNAHRWIEPLATR